MKIQQSSEDYLETILILENKTGYVRSVDIANELNYSKASVSRAMSILKSNDYIIIDNSGQIHLTQKGYDKANNVYERHRILTKFMADILKIDKVIAEQDACLIEHVISQTSFDKIKEFLATHHSK